MGVGSTQLSHVRDNPFTFDERAEMIKRSLRDYEERFKIVGISDLNDYPRWVAHVVKLSPKFGVVYTNSGLVRELFEKAEYTVESIPEFNRSIYSAREIRKRITEGEEYEHLLPDGSLEVLEEVGGVERIKKTEESN